MNAQDQEIMQAAVIGAFGPPDVLEVTELAVPSPRKGEVLIRIRAAGINAIDWFTRSGQGVGVREFPAVLGWDLSGVVAADARDAGLTEGDEVFGMARFPDLAGAYAEYAAVPASDVVAKPAAVDHQMSAAAPMAALTAWQTLYRHAAVAEGQQVLVHGAAGGVGHLAVQLAKLKGAEVIGTASAPNHDFVAGLGADRVVDYADLWGGRAVTDVDVIVDPRGDEDFDRLADLLAPGGVIVTLKGRHPRHEALVRAKRARVAYTYVAPDAAALDEVALLLADGKLRVAVDQVFGLGDAVEAHTVGEAGHVRGKLVLDLS